MRVFGLDLCAMQHGSSDTPRFIRPASLRIVREIITVRCLLSLMGDGVSIFEWHTEGIVGEPAPVRGRGELRDPVQLELVLRYDPVLRAYRASNE